MNIPSAQSCVLFDNAHTQYDPRRPIPGVHFSLSRSDFEDYIDAFVPKKNIPRMLGLQWSDLDLFCRLVYNEDFNAAYQRLIFLADAHDRVAFTRLAVLGNQTAIKVVAEHFMNLGPDNSDSPAVSVVISVPRDPDSPEAK